MGGTEARAREARSVPVSQDGGGGGGGLALPRGPGHQGGTLAPSLPPLTSGSRVGASRGGRGDAGRGRCRRGRGLSPFIVHTAWAAL